VLPREEQIHTVGKKNKKNNRKAAQKIRKGGRTVKKSQVRGGRKKGSKGNASRESSSCGGRGGENELKLDFPPWPTSITLIIVPKRQKFKKRNHGAMKNGGIKHIKTHYVGGGKSIVKDGADH